MKIVKIKINSHDDGVDDVQINTDSQNIFFSSGIIFSLLYISEDYSRNWHMFLSIEKQKRKRYGQ